MTEITCLGYPEVYRNGVKIQLPRKKSLALLIYLAETRKKAEREELRELFWPGSDRARGLGALRTSLAEISSLVDPALLGKENDAVFLTPLLFLCDSHEFLENEEKEQTLETLLDRERLWRGGFLKGFPLPEAPRFEDWVFRQEQYYDRLYRDLVKTLYYRFGKTGRFTEAVFHARKALSLDEYDEEALRAMMTALTLMGKRDEALARYESFRTRLEEELGYLPEKETEDIKGAVQGLNREALARYFPNRSRDFFSRPPRLALRKGDVAPELEEKIPEAFSLLTRAVIDRLSDFTGVEVMTRPLEERQVINRGRTRSLSPLFKADFILDITLAGKPGGAKIQTILIDLARNRILGEYEAVMRFSREVLLAEGYAVALGVAKKLNLSLHPDQRNRGTARPANEVTPLTVWKVRARQLLADYVPEKIQLAHRLLDKALENYPEDAETWAVKGQAFMCQNAAGLFGGDTEMMWSRAREMADRALKLNPEEPTALWVRGMILKERDRNPGKAEKDLFRAFEINPHDPALLSTLSEVLTCQGRFREALSMAVRACDLDPLYYWAYAARFWASVGLGQYRLTAEIQDQISLLFDFPLLSSYSRGFLELLQKNYPRAVEIIAPLKEELQERGLEPVLGLLAYAYARMGREQEARSLLKELHRTGSPMTGYFLPLSAAYAALGEEETACTLLEDALEQGEPHLFLLIATPFFETLGKTPRFQAVLQKAGLPRDQNIF